MIYCEKYNLIEQMIIPESYLRNCVRISISENTRREILDELAEKTNLFLVEEDELFYICSPSFHKKETVAARLYYFSNKEILEKWKDNVLIPFSLEN